MLLGLVSVVIVAAIGLAALVLTHRRAATPVRTTPAAATARRTVVVAPAPTAAPATPAAAVAIAPAPPIEPLQEVVPLDSKAVFARLHQLSLGQGAVGEPPPPSHAEVI